MTGIYKITSPTNKIYIGQSRNIKRRFSDYKSNRCKGQPKLYNSFKKHGIEKHKFEVITECNIEQLNQLERYYQDLYDVLNNGLNCMLTESEELPRVVRQETKDKISKGKHGRARKVIDISNGKIYDCILDASEYLNISKAHLNHMLKGRVKNITNIRYLNNDGLNIKSNIIVLALNNKNEIKEDTLKNISKLFNVSIETMKKYINKTSVPKNKAKSWTFKYKDDSRNYTEVKCDYKQKRKPYITSREKNLILDMDTGIYYYGCKDLLRFIEGFEKTNIKKIERYFNNNKSPLYDRFMLIS